MSDDDDQQSHRHHQHHQEPWSKGSAQVSVSVSSVSVAPVRSAMSPLAVSVSVPAFRASSTLEPEPEQELQQPQSNEPQQRSLSKSTNNSSSRAAPAASGPKREREREFRGKCLYQSRKCENERALKRNGKAHNLCDEHRSKQNQHQRKFDAKKFSRKRRSGARSGDDDDGDDDDEHQGDENDGEKNDQENLGAQRPDTKHSNESQREEPQTSKAASTSAVASKSQQQQRKIRRFEGTKYASQRRRQQERVEVVEGSSHPIKGELAEAGGGGGGVSPGAAGVSRNQGPERPPSPYVPEQYGGRNPVSHYQYQYQQSQEYAQRYSPPPGYIVSQSQHQQQHQQIQYQYHHQHHQGVRRSEDPEHYRPEIESTSSATPRGVPGIHAAVHPSPRPRSSSSSRTGNAPSGFAGRPLMPLRPLSTIVATPGSRIPSGGQRHPGDRGGPSPEQVYRQVQGVGPHSQPEGSDYLQRGAPFGGGAPPFQHHYQAEHSHPRPHASPPPSARAPVAQAAGYAPTKYSHSELIAASILVPGATDAASAPPVVASRQQYPEGVVVATAERGHYHTSVSPRGAPAMHHPSSYAISPHHARPQASPPSYEKQQQYYLRAQQSTQVPAAATAAASERHIPRYHSPPSTIALAQYPVATGSPHPPPPRMLPSLSSQAASVVSGSTPPSHSLSMPRALPSPSISSHRQYQPGPQQHQHQHQHQQHYQQHPQIILPPSWHSPLAPTPVLPSLAPLRTRDPSNPAKQ